MNPCWSAGADERAAIAHLVAAARGGRSGGVAGVDSPEPVAAGARRAPVADASTRGLVASPPAVDEDRARLRELGSEQKLKRGLRAFENVAMGFAAISPVVALYGVAAVGIALAGSA